MNTPRTIGDLKRVYDGEGPEARLLATFLAMIGSDDELLDTPEVQARVDRMVAESIERSERVHAAEAEASLRRAAERRAEERAGRDDSAIAPGWRWVMADGTREPMTNADRRLAEALLAAEAPDRPPQSQ